uniref:Uncharacterized protein n=1 Tax=Triticum urartu TaxID=4572 RepID=A0A8R7Q8M3_TRIUA
MHEARQRQLVGQHGELHPGAAPSPGAEGQEREVLPGTAEAAVPDEPLRRELLGAGPPRRRVAADGPGVDQDPGARRHVVAQQPGVLQRLPRQQQRRRRVEPQGLVDHGLQVGQVREMGLRDDRAGAGGDGRADLGLELAHLVRVVDELRHRPLEEREGRVRGGGEHVQDDGLDAVRAQLVGVQHHVHEVFLVPGGGGNTASLAVVGDDPLQQPVHLLEDSSRPPLQSRHRVHPSQPRHRLPHGHRSEELLHLAERLPQPRAAAFHPAVRVAERAAGDDRVGVDDEVVAQVHDAGTSPADPADERGGLLRPDAAQGRDAARAEHVGGADAARLAPVVAVGREADAAGAVVEAVDHEEPGAAGEVQVAGLHGLLRRGRGGGHDGGHAAEPQVHDRAVGRGQRPEAPVRQAPEQVEVADDRQAPRRRGQPQRTAAAPGGDEEGDHHEKEGEDGGEHGRVQRLDHHFCNHSS